MIKSNKIEQELENLINSTEGDGFGDPDAEKQHQRKIDLLKHKQILDVKKQNQNMTVLNVIIALLNLGIFIYQVFYK